MGRESYVPFALWLSAAIVAHIAWGGGAFAVAKVLEEIADVRWFASDVRSDLAQARSIEVTLEDGKVDETKPLEDQERRLDPPEAEKPKPQEPAPREANHPEDPKPEEQKPDPRKPIVIFPTPAAPSPPPPPPPPDREPPKSDQRIAVRQHVRPNQEDNSNARFIGDEANHVEEESVARITSHDRDDPNPTPGTNRAGAGSEPGNSTQNRIGQSDDAPGDPDKPPGESSDQHSAEVKATPAPPAVKVEAPSKPPEPPAQPGRAGQPSRPSQPAAPPAPPPEPVAPGPEALAGDHGGFTIDPRRKSRNRPASSAPLVPPGLAPSPMRLGARANDHGVRTSLAQPDVVAAVGADEISRMRAASGERRRSEHRGSWQGSTFERWRGAIENYVSSVKPGNQTALNTARVPFASYLNSIHNRLHPVFADTFLVSLDSLPFDHPMNDYKIYTSLEIVLEPKEGRIVKMGVVKTSGITAFDVGALDSVYRSQPFGQAPEAIISRDGNVYLHWEFHRNPIYACSTMNARPYMLNRPPAVEPGTPPPAPKPPADPREHPVPPPSQGPGRYGSGRSDRFRKAG